MALDAASSAIVEQKYLAMAAWVTKGKAGVAQTGGVVDHETRGFYLGSDFGDFELHALKISNTLAELLAFAGVLEGVFQRAFRQAEHLRGDADAAFVQSFDGDFIAFADFAHDLTFADGDIFEDQFAGGGSADAEFVFFLTDAEARSCRVRPGSR